MMNHKQFQAWLSQVDQLSSAQRGETEAALSGGDVPLDVEFDMGGVASPPRISSGIF